VSRGEAMDEDAMREQLRSFVSTRKKVRLTRCVPSEPLHNGFVVGVGRDWVLLQQFHDFYPEGYAALRVRDITDIRSGEYERHWERMLAGEGILDRLEVAHDVPLQDLPELLKALQQRGDNVIVECEDAEEDIEDFYIGRILSVVGDTLAFANFDALGHWDEAPHTIPLEEITKVEFDTPYVRTFSKYLEGSWRRTKRCS
jgi:hypothetical protein